MSKILSKTTILYSVTGSAILLTGLTVFALSNSDVYAQGFGKNTNSTSQSRSVAVQNQGQNPTSEDCIDFNVLPIESLSQEEKNSLLYMREEEKLARDVYLTLADKYNTPVFSNIANSEQQHMDTIKILIDKYGLEDPIKANEVGQFSSPILADLYTNLVDKGLESEVNALKVGATIEDLDIKDLNNDLAKTDNQDIAQVFASLRSGSYNHLRAFVRILENLGDEYSPQYISESEYIEIISSSNSQGQPGQKATVNRGQNSRFQSTGKKFTN